MAKKFTTSYLNSLKPTGKPYRRMDSDYAGFGVQVSGKGAVTFIFRYRSPITGKDVPMSIGKYRPASGGRVITSLADARQDACSLLAILEEGKDPKLERERGQQEAVAAYQEEQSKGSVKQLVDAYIESLRSKGKVSAGEVQRAIEFDLYRHVLGSTKARDVTTEAIKSVIAEPQLKRKSHIAANRLRSYLSAAFEFGIHWDNDVNRGLESLRFGIVNNPVLPIPPPSVENVRHRYLTEVELKQFWGALDKSACNEVTKQAIKLIYSLGGQRVMEALRLCEEHINWDENYVILYKTKIGNNHTVPYGSIAEGILRDAASRAGKGLLFPVRVDVLNRAVQRICKREGMQLFVTRDARETVKTLLGKRVPSKEARDKYQNHGITKDASGKHYDSHDYLNVTRPVAEVWNAQLLEIITGETVSNIIPLRSSLKR